MRFSVIAHPLVIAGYESPCGVMRPVAVKSVDDDIKLRIPMRGYEIHKQGSVVASQIVTNPHAGL